MSENLKIDPLGGRIWRSMVVRERHNLLNNNLGKGLGTQIIKNTKNTIPE